jgi:hypothetical protein
MSWRTGRSFNKLLEGSIQEFSPTKEENIKQNLAVARNFELLSKIPGVSIAYPDEVLFDQKSQKYKVMLNDKLLYVDTNHLSSVGSVYVSRVFGRYFENQGL